MAGEDVVIGAGLTGPGSISSSIGLDVNDPGGGGTGRIRSVDQSSRRGWKRSERRSKSWRKREEEGVVGKSGMRAGDEVQKNNAQDDDDDNATTDIWAPSQANQMSIAKPHVRLCRNPPSHVSLSDGCGHARARLVMHMHSWYDRRAGRGTTSMPTREEPEGTMHVPAA